MREPRPGDRLLSRDRRYGRTFSEVYGISDRFVYVRRFRKTRVRRDRFHKAYWIVEGA